MWGLQRQGGGPEVSVESVLPLQTAGRDWGLQGEAQAEQKIQKRERLRVRYTLQ